MYRVSSSGGLHFHFAKRQQVAGNCFSTRGGGTLKREKMSQLGRNMRTETYNRQLRQMKTPHQLKSEIFPNTAGNIPQTNAFHFQQLWDVRGNFLKNSGATRLIGALTPTICQPFNSFYFIVFLNILTCSYIIR